MKKFFIGLLTGVLAVPAIFVGASAIIAKNNDRTLKQEWQQWVAEETIEAAEDEEKIEDDDLDYGIGSGEDQGTPVGSM